jgi:hypothetical protein
MECWFLKEVFPFVNNFHLPVKRKVDKIPIAICSLRAGGHNPLFFALTSFRSVPASGSPVSNIPVFQHSNCDLPALAIRSGEAGGAKRTKFDLKTPAYYSNHW